MLYTENYCLSIGSVDFQDFHLHFCHTFVSKSIVTFVYCADKKMMKKYLENCLLMIVVTQYISIAW